ncbi:MAG: hypothetical protein ACOCP8_00135 [archaeon]
MILISSTEAPYGITAASNLSLATLLEFYLSNIILSKPLTPSNSLSHSDI